MLVLPLIFVLVAGDGDYVPLVHYLKFAKGCRVEVMAFGESTSQKLRESADTFIDMSSDKKKYLLPMRGSIRPNISRPRFLGGQNRPQNPPAEPLSPEESLAGEEPGETDEQG